MESTHGSNENLKRTISVVVENKFGVLARIATLFAARGYNIDSLAVGETEDPAVSRMTIVASGSEAVLEQVEKQLNTLIDVIKVNSFEKEPHIERDLALIKVAATNSTRNEIFLIVDIFRARVVDVASDYLIVEITGGEDKIQALETLLKPFGIKEMVRTGIIAMARGNKKNGDK